MCADLSQSSWSEIDSNNNQGAPLGWTPGTMLPTQVEPTAQAMMGAQKRWWNRQNPTYAPSLTTTDTYALTPQSPVTSYTAFELWTLRMPSSNLTTTPTLNLGPSAATIQKYVSGSLTALAVGDIQAQTHQFYYNGAAAVMVLTNPASQNFGAAAFKGVSSAAQPNVASVSGTTSTNNILVAADVSGTIKDSGQSIQTFPPFGAAAQKGVSSTSLTALVAVSGSFTTGHLLAAADTSGSAQDSGIAPGTAASKAASSTSATLVSAQGSFTVGHLLVAADTSGSASDGGAPSGSTTYGAVGTYTSVSAAPATYTPGTTYSLSGFSLSGTWRCMGAGGTYANGLSLSQSALFVPSGGMGGYAVGYPASLSYASFADFLFVRIS